MSISRFLLMTLIIVAIGGCGSFPEPDPETDAGTHSEPVTAEPEPTTEDCNWSQKRGIAELMEVRNGTGLFHFHPDSIPVTQGIDPDWSVGDEFKAILETPEPTGCADKRLTRIRPLAPTD